MKYCPSCKANFSIDAFAHDASRPPLYRDTYCKECRSQMRNYRKQFGIKQQKYLQRKHIPVVPESDY